MTSKLLTATALAFTFALGAQGAFAQDAVTCEGLTIVSVTPSGITSQIDGEFTVYSFDLTATIGGKPPSGNASSSERRR